MAGEAGDQEIWSLRVPVPEGDPAQYQAGAAVTSIRKPCNDWAGYVASLRNRITGDYTVIVRAKEHGIDDAGGKYAVICNRHGSILNVSSIPKARPFMKEPEFCEDCESLRLQP